MLNFKLIHKYKKKILYTKPIENDLYCSRKLNFWILHINFQITGVENTKELNKAIIKYCKINMVDITY